MLASVTARVLRAPAFLFAALALSAGPAHASGSFDAPVHAADALVAAPAAPAPRADRRIGTGRAAAATTTGDPRRAEQWPLATDTPVGAQTAWRQSKGAGVIVAVVDSGVNLTHPDLAPNLWTNPGELPGNGIDDDADGIVDDVHGADFVSGDGDPSDGNGHGTHVAGIIAARDDNGIGGAGIAPRATIMPVRVLDNNAGGLTSTVAAGVRYAIAHGARIINLSLAGPGFSQELQDVLAEARTAGVLVVAAAGNDGRSLAAAPSYPASMPLENIIGVAATTERGALATISDWGPGVDIAAPGDDILSTASDGGYEWRTGTSMAAPYVAGTLALLASARPDLTWQGLESALFSAARPSALDVGNGTLDAGAALRGAIPAASWVDAPAVSTVAVAGAKTAKAKTSAKTKSKASSKKAKKLSKAARAKAAKAKKAKAAKARKVRAAKAARARAARARAARAGAGATRTA